MLYTNLFIKIINSITGDSGERMKCHLIAVASNCNREKSEYTCVVHKFYQISSDCFLRLKDERKAANYAYCGGSVDKEISNRNLLNRLSGIDRFALPSFLCFRNVIAKQKP